MNNIPVAVQLFTLREETEKDFAGTLKRVAELGFDGVEFAGFGELSAKEVKALLDEYGLKASSSHVPLDRIQEDIENVIEEQKIIGSRYVVCPYILPEQRSEENYRALLQTLETAGEACRKEGLTLCYHNHDFELEKMADGRTVLETILDETKTAAEFDIYWLTKAGEQPAEWIKKYAGRTPLVHLKDMTTDDVQFFAELGTGGVDIEAVLETAEATNVEWWVVEQDMTKRTPFESIEMSLDYLKTKLPHLAGK
ncbi:sugar phosphate isomerase/epimerase family protein [Domibacillus enclensis]|uniref:Sugar phosphate isomerase/epimerase n=1 Tax=Domibacillus enclensis TaxID=1017273 RepID=A0A1N7CR36_9BACI|nr:sugar phosphate isomerase/epimerase [Domibacillus enclensis]OXS73431.1 xylose isomerase [Domibacillus enclensis]SIR66108.1 Sugar phosphate isomerase/epimerase [Domibacillus enclensis]